MDIGKAWGPGQLNKLGVFREGPRARLLFPQYRPVFMTPHARKYKELLYIIPGLYMDQFHP